MPVDPAVIASICADSVAAFLLLSALCHVFFQRQVGYWLAKPAVVIALTQRVSKTLEEIVARRIDELTAYQDENYARRYRDLVERAKQRET